MKRKEVIMTNFCIAPEFWNMGIGAEFLNIVFEELERVGYTAIHFDCLQENDAALRVYKKTGCEIINGDRGFSGSDPKPRTLQLIKVLDPRIHK